MIVRTSLFSEHQRLLASRIPDEVQQKFLPGMKNRTAGFEVEEKRQYVVPFAKEF